ncbi:hypothetical protein [Nostocoides sp. HKS02]|uniref:hypothetical protein n=1 Tax=Nostocoides sp. HKS02 TaxID=1813880 RepID=UPI0012B4B06A|nr:hypothetical protein [Tetrasphaera sp. HKS02]QGN58511.1 hypothetical protein GKE56_12130 [Tetrasphaera sp. HKS02]
MAAQMPQICVKTGVPTADTLTIRGRATPVWAWAMIVFGFLPWLVAQAGSSHRYAITVPLQRAVFQRYRQWRRASWVLAALGITLMLGAAAVDGERALLLLAVTLVGLAWGLVNEWVNSVGIRLTREGALLMTRVHPAFREAVLRQDAAKADA